MEPEPTSADPIAPIEKFLACVHCGLCLSSCPTYLETGSEAESPRGRIHLMRGLNEGSLAATEGAVRHLDLCLGCRACETACPSGVEYGVLIEGARHFLRERGERSAISRRWRRWLARRLPDPLRWRSWLPWMDLAVAARIPRLASIGWMPRSIRRLAALLPEPGPSRPLRALYEPAGEPRGTVALLTGCAASVLFSAVNDWTARLLALAGWRVVVPQAQRCCGALLAHLGEREEAERLARRNVSVLLQAEPDWVVTNAAGCGAHLRQYGALLRDDAMSALAAKTLAARTRDVTELLALGGLPPPAREIRARVAYHDACHLAHGQGVRREPRALLEAIPGLEVVEIPGGELCCGSAGTYNLTEPGMAWRLGERRARAILETGAEMVAAGNPGCILQIRAALRLAGGNQAVLHPVELLARAYL